MRHHLVLMRSLIAALLLGFTSISSAMALTGATADSADRFPFVVEVKYQDKLICSGTVLFPRIVVTAAHCVQQKVYFRGGQYYADDYLHPAELTVTVTHDGKAKDHAVADVTASPVWRGLEAGSAGQRFAHDLALIVTKEPIVGLPPSLDKLADDETLGPEIISARPDDATVTPKYQALRGVLATGSPIGACWLPSAPTNARRSCNAAMPASAATCRSRSRRAPIASMIPAAARATRHCRQSSPRCCRSPCGAWIRASCPEIAAAHFWSRGSKGSSIISA